MSLRIPTLEETTLGVFLHDIGKFMQRALGTVQNLPAQLRNLESVLLPTFKGIPTHKHALWTAAFFDVIEKSVNMGLPHGLNHHAVYNVAAYHHRPDAIVSEIGAIAILAAEADRLASGMDRKPKDEELEQQGGKRAWDTFMKTPLRNPFASVDLKKDLGTVESDSSFLPLTGLRPGDSLMPVTKENFRPDELPDAYAALWKEFLRHFQELPKANTNTFLEALLSLSEHYCFGIPSSTIDQNDISLHDHHRAAAAVAAAMYQWHDRDSSLNNAVKVRDRELPKYRFIVGDLSGIQSTLFQLPSQQVRGVNKILRARSFLFSMLLETAALELRTQLNLPVFSVLQCAGGRLLMLVGNTDSNEEVFQTVRRHIEQWMFLRYRGSFALNLSLSRPFRGVDLMLGNYQRVEEELRLCAETAKQQPFSTCLQIVHRDMVYRDQTCSACGIRPWVHNSGDETDPILRCEPCSEEQRLGGALPKTHAIAWRKTNVSSPLARVSLFSGWQLHLHESLDDAAFDSGSSFQVFRPAEPVPYTAKLPRRFLANYVPHLRNLDLDDGRYAALDLSEEARQTQPGELKLFEHIAADALEFTPDGDARGRAHLAVLKADVDRLGQVFASKSGASSLSRFAALSRLMDFFFTGHLNNRLATVPDFQSTYTVYAGGDDLLLIGPWRQIIHLAMDLRTQFAAWVGENPNITISAGIELMKPHYPIQRITSAAEARLSDAKDGGRNRISVIQSESISWPDLEIMLRHSERLNIYLRDQKLTTSFVYRLLHFDALRQRSESSTDVHSSLPLPLDLDAAGWRPQWAYSLARNVRDRYRSDQALLRELTTFLNSLLGLDVDLRKQFSRTSAVVPVTLALYRNRN